MLQGGSRILSNVSCPRREAAQQSLGPPRGRPGGQASSSISAARACRARDASSRTLARGPVSKPLRTDGKAKLTHEVANEMQKVITRFNSEREANMLWRRWSREGKGGTAKGPGGAGNSRSTYNRKQRNFTCSVVLMHQQS